MKIEFEQVGPARVSVENEQERRAISLRFALDAKPFTLMRDDDPEEYSNRLVDMARVFEDYIDRG